MVCPLFCMYCASNVSWTKCVKIFILFSLAFAATFAYLNYSVFTNWTTSVYVSFVTSAIFTTGLTCSLYLRCAAVLFLIQCLSRFGLSMLFVAVSWILIQTGIGVFIHNHRIGLEVIGLRDNITNNDTDAMEDYELRLLSGIMGYMHYGILSPFVCIYIYSVLYEITFVARASYKKSGKKLSKGRVYLSCMQVGNNFMMFFVGFVFSCTLTTVLGQYLAYVNLLYIVRKLNIQTDQLYSMSSGWLAFYLTTCFVFLVFVPFSKIVTKFRRIIIQNYFRIYHGQMISRNKNVFITKSKSKRVKWSDLKQKKSTKSAITNQQEQELTTIQKPPENPQEGIHVLPALDLEKNLSKVSINRTSDSSDSSDSDTSEGSRNVPSNLATYK